MSNNTKVVLFGITRPNIRDQTHTINNKRTKSLNKLRLMFSEIFLQVSSCGLPRDNNKCRVMSISNVILKSIKFTDTDCTIYYSKQSN